MGRRAATGPALVIVGVLGVLSACTAAGSAPTAIGTTESPAPTVGAGTPPPKATPDMRPIPLPLDTFRGTVQDPAKATLTLEDALRAGRAITDNIIGPDPVARLMLISDDTEKDNGGFGPTLAWVFVADDVKPIMGTGLPTTTSPVPYHGCLSWTMIDMNGRMIAQLQSRYLGPKFPPSLPRS